MKVTIDGIEYAPALVFANADTRTLPMLLTDIRNALGWTLDEAIARIDCHKSSLYSIEHGLSTNPSFRLVAKISRAYGVPIHILAAAALNEETQ